MVNGKFLGSPLIIYRLALKIMFRTLFFIFGFGVILLYAASSWFGWEFANSGSRSRLGMPFIYSGFRGGK